MPPSLRASLLTLLAAGSLLPLVGLAIYEERAVAHAEAERDLAQMQSLALAAALRADAAAARGEDPVAAAREAAPDEEVVLVGERGSEWPAFRARAGDTLSGVAFLPRPDGREALVAWARAPALGADLVLVREPPSGVPLPSPAFLLLAAFLFAGVALLLGFIGARVLAPVARLERASRRLARGEWGEPVPIEGPSEVRALATAFNEMARALDAQRARLSALLDERTRTLIDRESDLEALRFTLAHEFREPLRSLKWMADDLAERPLDQSAREAVDVLRRRIDDIDHVFRDLLRYEEISRRPVRPQRVELAEVVADAAAAAEEVAPLDLEHGPLPVLHADRGLLTAAFGELLRNAAQHGRRSGAPAVVRIAAHDAPEGAAVIVHVDDRGPGIPPARREDVLHLFQRLRRDVRGTGAGLAIARRAAERLGGSLALDEAPGGGARVVLRLPLEPPTEPAPLPREPPKRAF